MAGIILKHPITLADFKKLRKIEFISYQKGPKKYVTSDSETITVVLNRHYFPNSNKLTMSNNQFNVMWTRKLDSDTEVIYFSGKEFNCDTPRNIIDRINSIVNNKSYNQWVEDTYARRSFKHTVKVYYKT